MLSLAIWATEQSRLPRLFGLAWVFVTDNLIERNDILRPEYQPDCT